MFPGQLFGKGFGIDRSAFFDDFFHFTAQQRVRLVHVADGLTPELLHVFYQWAHELRVELAYVPVARAGKSAKLSVTRWAIIISTKPI